MTRGLAQAHTVACDLLKLLTEFQDLCSELQVGMRSNDPRLDEITRLRARLQSQLELATKELIPSLPEFACVQEWPVTINGFTAASAHQAALKFGEWVYAQKWRTAGYREFFGKYYDPKTGKMDWDSVSTDGDETHNGIYDFWARRDWDEHRALLEMEYAKASKLSMFPNADVPKMVDIERNVVEALGDETLTGREIAEKAGYPYNSNLRTRLARMVEGQLLEKVQPHGYRRRGVIGVG